MKASKKKTAISNPIKKEDCLQGLKKGTKVKYGDNPSKMTFIEYRDHGFTAILKTVKGKKFSAFSNQIQVWPGFIIDAKSLDELKTRLPFYNKVLNSEMLRDILTVEMDKKILKQHLKQTGHDPDKIISLYKAKHKEQFDKIQSWLKK